MYELLPEESRTDVLTLMPLIVASAFCRWVLSATIRYNRAGTVLVCGGRDVFALDKGNQEYIHKVMVFRLIKMAVACTAEIRIRIGLSWTHLG